MAERRRVRETVQHSINERENEILRGEKITVKDLRHNIMAENN